MIHDVAVVGGGIGGVSAGARAAETGAAVVLVEAGDVLGGTALFSGGGVHIWGVETWEEYLRHCPNSPPLARTMVENYRRYVEWLISTGAPGDWGTSTFRGLTLTKYQIGRAFAPDRKLAWFRYLGERVGTVLTGRRVEELEVDDVGFRLTGPQLDLRARSVVLAAGGWQASPQLVAEHTGAPADRFVPRSVPHDVGDGLRLAQSVGAAATESTETIYGHLMPAPPCRVGWTNYVDPGLLSAFYAEQSLILNVHGERFVDEGAGELTGETINACASQPPGELWIVFDEEIRRRAVRFDLSGEMLRPALRNTWLAKYLRLRGGRPILDTLRFARDRGAVILKTQTVEELARRLGPHALETIRQFNEAARAGTAGTLPVPKTHAVNTIQRPPFYAIKVAVGVSMTYGGVAIDERTRALDEHGRPVRGLYAVPGTAGGVHQLHYGGALAPAGVFGMIAGEEAARSLAKVAAAV